MSFQIHQLFVHSVGRHDVHIRFSFHPKKTSKNNHLFHVYQHFWYMLSIHRSKPKSSNKLRFDLKMVVQLCNKVMNRIKLKKTTIKKSAEHQQTIFAAWSEFLNQGSLYCHTFALFYTPKMGHFVTCVNSRPFIHFVIRTTPQAAVLIFCGSTLPPLGKLLPTWLFCNLPWHFRQEFHLVGGFKPLEKY